MKQKLRVEVINQLSKFTSEEKSAKDMAINQNLIEFFQEVKDKNILSFQPFQSEPDITETNKLLAETNKLFFADKKQLIIYDEKKQPITDFSNIEYIVIPALAVTKTGVRLGRGKGWYDRLLAQTSAVKVCVLYASQILEDIPEDQYDQRIDIIIDELEIINCKNFVQQGI